MSLRKDLMQDLSRIEFRQRLKRLRLSLMEGQGSEAEGAHALLLPMQASSVEVWTAETAITNGQNSESPVSDEVMWSLRGAWFCDRLEYDDADLEEVLVEAESMTLRALMEYFKQKIDKGT